MSVINLNILTGAGSAVVETMSRTDNARILALSTMEWRVNTAAEQSLKLQDQLSLGSEALQNQQAEQKSKEDALRKEIGAAEEVVKSLQATVSQWNSMIAGEASAVQQYTTMNNVLTKQTSQCCVSMGCAHVKAVIGFDQTYASQCNNR